MSGAIQERTAGKLHGLGDCFLRDLSVSPAVADEIPRKPVLHVGKHVSNCHSCPFEGRSSSADFWMSYNKLPKVFPPRFFHGPSMAQTIGHCQNPGSRAVQAESQTTMKTNSRGDRLRGRRRSQVQGYLT